MKVLLGGHTVWINYHHLYCFYMIATEGSMSRASEKMGIGQSALSIQIRQFEESLGTQLFERSHRKLSLNEHGKVVLEYGKEIFRLGSEMVETLNDRPAPGRTHLQIGALDSVPKHLTLQLARTALLGSRCSISILEGKTADLLAQLTDHRIDLLLTNFLPSAPGERIYAKRIARRPLWIVGGKSFLGLKKGFPNSLDGKPFVVPTADSSVRQEIENFCMHHRIQPDFVAEAQDVMIQKLLALEEVGLTVVPEFAVREYLDRKELYLIGKLDEAQEDLYLISASRKIENPVASHLMRSFQVK